VYLYHLSFSGLKFLHQLYNLKRKRRKRKIKAKTKFTCHKKTAKERNIQIHENKESIKLIPNEISVTQIRVKRKILSQITKWTKDS